MPDSHDSIRIHPRPSAKTVRHRVDAPPPQTDRPVLSSPSASAGGSVVVVRLPNVASYRQRVSSTERETIQSTADASHTTQHPTVQKSPPTSDSATFDDVRRALRFDPAEGRSPSQVGSGAPSPSNADSALPAPSGRVSQRERELRRTRQELSPRISGLTSKILLAVILVVAASLTVWLTHGFEFSNSSSGDLGQSPPLWSTENGNDPKGDTWDDANNWAQHEDLDSPGYNALDAAALPAATDWPPPQATTAQSTIREVPRLAERPIQRYAPESQVFIGSTPADSAPTASTEAKDRPVASLTGKIDRDIY